MSLIALPLRSLFMPMLLVAALRAIADKPRIAIFSGPTATIQNSESLITSNKARDRRIGIIRVPPNWMQSVRGSPRIRPFSILTDRRVLSTRWLPA